KNTDTLKGKKKFGSGSGGKKPPSRRAANDNKKPSGKGQKEFASKSKKSNQKSQKVVNINKGRKKPTDGKTKVALKNLDKLKQLQTQKKTVKETKGTKLAKPIVTSHPDGLQAKWAKDPKARIMIQPKGNRVNVSDIYRSNQPKGSGGRMLADVLKGAKIKQPAAIRFTNITEKQPTRKQLENGVLPRKTVLGKTMHNTVAEMGGKITRWNHGKDSKGKLYLEAQISYK
ncbi:MAG: hypothetical protein GY797_30855, partial [Deltaproteobacteria bacterium]|nr:hypothetical protein [Deltaproteobacteria bacterium]